VGKRYGDIVALESCSLEVKSGELLSLVGPSGCGKSTLLKVVAGFLAADSGDVRICGRRVNDLPVRERGIAFVMERLGLYPHLNVFENIAYPLRVRRLNEPEIRRRVLSICELTGIDGLEHRKPSDLSGGQRQRVAVARALVRDDASVLLADECFSDLDAQLKFQLRGEFRSWQRGRGLTCIFVTHDQEEALALGDRIALMTTGHIDQIGTPDEVYERPDTLFAASFLGRPAVNLVPMTTAKGDVWALGRSCRAELGAVNGLSPQDVVLGVRAEDVQILTDGASGIQATVEWVEPLNPDTLVHLTIEGQKVVARIRATVRLNSGTSVWVKIEESRWHLFDRRTGVRILKANY